MKKLMSVLCLVAACSVAFGFALESNTPLVNPIVVAVTANPYCGKTAADFAIPDPVCPVGCYMGPACVKLCHEAYEHEMLIYYTNACTQYGTAVEAYDKAITKAFDDYDKCIASATTPAQRQACRTQALADITTASSTLAAVKSGIDATIASMENNQRQIFNACALACCNC